METNKNIDVDLYRKIGTLFYAIAAIDRHIMEEEITTMKSLLKSEWLSSSIKVNGESKNAIFYIEDAFRQLQREKKDANCCFDDFITFKNGNDYLFTKKLKQFVFKIASKIASSFSGKNKKELILLGKLDLNFRKT